MHSFSPIWETGTCIPFLLFEKQFLTSNSYIYRILIVRNWKKLVGRRLCWWESGAGAWIFKHCPQFLVKMLCKRLLQHTLSSSSILPQACLEQRPKPTGINSNCSSMQLEIYRYSWVSANNWVGGGGWGFVVLFAGFFFKKRSICPYLHSFFPVASISFNHLHVFCTPCSTTQQTLSPLLNMRLWPI